MAQAALCCRYPSVLSSSVSHWCASVLRHEQSGWTVCCSKQNLRISILQRLLGSSMVNFGNRQIHYRLLLRASQPRRRWCYHCTGSGNDDGYLSPFLCFLFLPQGRMSHPCHLGFEICGPVTLFSSGKHDY